MATRFPLGPDNRTATAALFPEYEMLYTLIDADMGPDKSVVAAFFIRSIQNLASGNMKLDWMEDWHRDNLIARAANAYTHRA
jgi:hypothetical protein